MLITQNNINFECSFYHLIWRKKQLHISCCLPGFKMTFWTTAMIGLGSEVWCQWRLEKFFYNIIGDYWERNLTWLGGLFGLHLFGLFGYIGTILFLNRKFLFLNLNVWVLTIYVDEEFFLFYWMFHESIGIFERIVGWILEEKRKYFVYTKMSTQYEDYRKWCYNVVEWTMKGMSRIIYANFKYTAI